MPDTSRRNRTTRRALLPAVALLVLLAAQAMLAGLPLLHAQQSQPASSGQSAGRGLPAPLTADDFMRMLPPTDLSGDGTSPHGTTAGDSAHARSGPAPVWAMPCASRMRSVSARPCTS